MGRAWLVALGLTLAAAEVEAAPPCLPDGVVLASRDGGPTVCTTAIAGDGLPTACWDLDPTTGALTEIAPAPVPGLAARGITAATALPGGGVHLLDDGHLGVATWGLRQLTVVDLRTGRARSVRRAGASRGCTRRELADLADGFDHRVSARCASAVRVHDAPLIGAHLVRLATGDLLALSTGAHAGELRIFDGARLRERSTATVSTCRPAAPVAATCRPLGEWSVTWGPLDGAVGLRALRRELTVRVDATAAAAEGWADQIGVATDSARVEVDRARCLATLDLATEFAFADDAGDRREQLQLELDLRADGGNTRGTLRLREVGPDPEDRRVPVGGRVRRVIDAP